MGALLSALRGELTKLSKDAAENAAPYVDAIEVEAKKEKPNKGFLQMTRKGLTDAAKTCAAIAPPVLKAADAVVEWFARK